MAQTIQLTPETLRSQAAQIRTCAQEHIDLMQRMTNLVLTLEETWKGKAQTAFVENYQGMRDSFDSFDNALLSLAEIMESHAAKMESTDRSMRSMINSIG